MVFKKHSYFHNTDAITAETLARTTADGFKTQLFPIIQLNNSRNFS
jgi:aromatic ring-cleaving dioxygenase